MSLNKTQLDALIDRNCKSNSVSYPVAEKTADENLALDKVTGIIFTSSGRWQYDDTNHEDYPIITTNLTSGQRDYTFTTDEQGNLILDIYRVMVKNRDGVFYEIDKKIEALEDSGSYNYDNHLKNEVIDRISNRLALLVKEELAALL